MGSEDPEITQVPRITEDQQRTLSTILSILGETATSIPTSVVNFPTFTEEAPGLSSLEMLSLEGLENFARGVQGGSQGRTLQRGRETVEGFLDQDFDQEAFDEFFRGSVQQPLTQQFQEEVLPAISRSTAQSGAFGSARRRADELATEDLVDALAQQRSTLAFGARQSAMDRALQAGLATPSVVGAEGNILASLLSAGAVPRTVAAQQFAARRAEFQRQLDEAARRLGLGGQLSAAPTLDIVGVPGDPGLLPGLIQAGGTVGGAGIMAAALAM